MPLSYTELPYDDSPSLTCCQRACPVGTDVSSYVALIAQGKFSEALAIVREENPFPSVCGRVCDHACELHCRRAESDQPVAIRALKRFLADRERATVQWPKRIKPWQEQKVAIIGSGPAGLTAASDLLRGGFEVTVFESLPVAGGMMRVGIPDYRLPPEVLDFDIEYLRRLGIEIKLNTTLGRDITLPDLKAQGYKAVLLATGAHSSRTLKVKGIELSGVAFGIDFLREVNLGGKPQIGQRVVVIGGGDVAMDTARTALRLGAKQVDLFCLESRQEMPAHDWETREALDEQIRFSCGWGPAEFIGTDRVRQVKFQVCTSVFNSSGRFAPTFDSAKTTTIEADTVLLAIGQVAQFAHEPDDGVQTTPNRLYQADSDTLQTTTPWVFAAGDAVYGTATVIQAVASGHRAATSISEYLQSKPLTGQWTPPAHEQRVERLGIPPGWEEIPSVQEPELPADKRVQSFAEVKLSLTEAAAITEALRCLRCDYETNSYTYSRRAREEIYHLARDIGNDEAACLDFLQQELAYRQNRPGPRQDVSPFEDLVFLPANLTRLVIDPYREKCNTRTVIGVATSKPLELAGPVLIGGLDFSRVTETVLAALCRGAASAGLALRVPIGFELPREDLPVVRLVPLKEQPISLGIASAVELISDNPGRKLDVDTLAQAARSCRDLTGGVPVGISLGPERVAVNVQIAVEAGLDFVTLLAVKPSKARASSADTELNGLPEIGVLADAVEGLRAINREEDIDLLYFGCIRDGGDTAKALALGAKAVVLGQAALIAAQSVPSDAGVDQGALAVQRFIQAIFMEISILARSCGKTDVHNLEPEDLRSLSIETSRSTGMPLVGRDINFRKTMAR